MTVLIPALRHIFPMPFGFSVLAAGIVLAVMIFPTITTMSADAMAAVPKSWREASYGLGATRWETIAHVVLPAAKSGIFTGIILGLARALGEALAVAMVIGQMKVFPTSLFLPASTLTTQSLRIWGARWKAANTMPHCGRWPCSCSCCRSCSFLLSTRSMPLPN